MDIKIYFDNGVKRFFSVLCVGWKSLKIFGVFMLVSNVEWGFCMEEFLDVEKKGINYGFVWMNFIIF